MVDKVADSRFEAKVGFAGKGYFMREGSSDETKSALHFGPTRCSDEVHRHVTVVFDVETGEVDNLHLTWTREGRTGKKWWIFPERVGSAVAGWISVNSQPLTSSVTVGLDRDYYCVSTWRVIAGFRLIEGFMQAASWFVARPLAALGVLRMQIEEDKVQGKLRAIGRVDADGLLRLLRSFRPFRGIMQTVCRGVLPTAVRVIGRLSLTRLWRMSTGDVSLLVPKREGLPMLVVVKWDQYLVIEAKKAIAKATALYEEYELRQLIPELGKLGSAASLPFWLSARGLREIPDP